MENILKPCAQANPRIAKDLGLADEAVEDVGGGVGHGMVAGDRAQGAAPTGRPWVLGRCAHSQRDALLFGNFGNAALVTVAFDDQIHRHVEPVLQLDFATDFFHEVQLGCFDIQVHIAAFGLVIYARPKQHDPRTIAQHGLCCGFDDVDLGRGQAHGFI